MSNNYKNIYKHYETCFSKYGDTCKGLDWPNYKDMILRYKIMLDINNFYNLNKFSILDFGAGTGNLYEYINNIINKKNNYKIEYSALDISSIFCDTIKKKYDNINVYNIDIIKDNIDYLPIFDYIVLNGVFTEKRNLSEDEMWDFLTNILLKIYPKVKYGISFNVMTPIVDWKDDKLFYLSFDKISRFIKENFSKKFVINQSYGLWEYTVYILKV